MKYIIIWVIISFWFGSRLGRFIKDGGEVGRHRK